MLSYLDCYTAFEPANYDLLDQWITDSACKWSKTERDIFNELSTKFSFKKALIYLWKLCRDNPDQCGSGYAGLQLACERNYSNGTEYCRGQVKTVLEKFCSKKTGASICDGIVKATTQAVAAVVVPAPAPLAPMAPPTVTQEPESATKKSTNILLYAGIGGAALLLFFGAMILIFCMMSNKPEPPPPAQVTVVKGRRRIKKRKNHQKRRGSKSKMESKKGSSEQEPGSKDSKSKKVESNKSKESVNSKSEKPASEKKKKIPKNTTKSMTPVEIV